MDMLRTRSNETIYSCRCSFHYCCSYFNTFDCCYCFERSLMCLSYSERDFDIVAIRNVSCSRLMICESKIAFICSEKVLEALSRVLTLPNHTSRRVLLKSSRFVDLKCFRRRVSYSNFERVRRRLFLPLPKGSGSTNPIRKDCNTGGPRKFDPMVHRVKLPPKAQET